MATVHEQLSQHFHNWERRGRGWQIFDSPVYPEPPFEPFLLHYLPEQTATDDGRRPTVISSLFRRLTGQKETPPVIPEREDEPEPQPFEREAVVEVQVSLPSDFDAAPEAVEQMLLNVGMCRDPVAFELLGVPERVSAQFAASPADAPLLRRQLQAHFPEAVFQQGSGILEASWQASHGKDVLVFEVGLAREFMLPLARSKIDPFVGLIGALAELHPGEPFVGIVGALAHLQPGELGLFQVVFQAAQEPWSEEIVRSVTDEEGKPFFINMPELVGHAKTKTSRPLYAAVVRLAVRTNAYERTLQIARDLAGSLRTFANPNGNELIPLSNEEYPLEEHVEDVLRRQSRRIGMLLNSAELTGFVHLPASAVRSSAFARQSERTKAAPAVVRRSSGVLLGDNVHAGEAVEVRVIPEQRVRHMHVLGASGTGKSTLLYNLIKQDIENGEGVAVLDPHGDLIDRVLGIIPESRIEDVVLVDPSDEEFPVGFNVLHAHSELEKNLLSSDLVSVFQRLSTSWGDQMASVLNNAILAFLESSREGTLGDLRRFLLDPSYRAEFLDTVRDPEVVYYWKKGFAQLSGNKSIGPVLTRLEAFLARKPIRYMVSQKENRLDFAQIMDTGKIFLAKLSQGLLGAENAYLLGTLLVSKFQQLAMSRQQQAQGLRRNFWLYIDEFAYFITPTMAEILTGARKYRVGLILAHQELRQLQRDSEVAGAVLSNPYTRIVFRVGDDDARKLASGFASFEPEDLQNLETGKAVVRVERSDFDFNLIVERPEDPHEEEVADRRQAVIDASRRKYATPRAEVEAKLYRDILPTDEPRPKPKPSEPKPPPKAQVRPEQAEIGPVPALQAQPLMTQAEEANTESAPTPISSVERSVAKSAHPAADLGRGGAQHKAIQFRVKDAAEKLGFRSVIEKQILDGQGSIDLLVERPDQTVACEISISTTIDHEVGNVAKCFKAGMPKVAVICITEERLSKIRAAVHGSLGSELASRVIYFQPDDFISHLASLHPPTSKTSAEPEVRRGYKIKRSMTKLAPEEQKHREEAAIRSIAETMRERA